MGGRVQQNLPQLSEKLGRGTRTSPQAVIQPQTYIELQFNHFSDFMELNIYLMNHTTIGVIDRDIHTTTDSSALRDYPL